jgi:hypothetical protein
MVAAGAAGSQDASKKAPDALIQASTEISTPPVSQKPTQAAASRVLSSSVFRRVGRQVPAFQQAVTPLFPSGLAASATAAVA